MTTNDRIDTRKKGDAVTAHLALAVDDDGHEGGEKSGSCLSSEQLAAIAMGSCSPKEKKLALAHFAECKRCYDALVAISFSIASVERSGKQSRSASTVRNLTWLGSAFAIAASVLVFINIRDVNRSLDQPVPPSAPVIERSAVEREPASGPVSDSMPERAKAVQKRAMPEAMSMTGQEQNWADTGEPVRLEEDTKEDIAASSSQIDKQQGRINIREWKKALTASCIDRQESHATWSTLKKQGLQAVTQLADEPGRAGQLKKIVNLIPGDGARPDAQQCARIFTLLAEQSEWE